MIILFWGTRFRKPPYIQLYIQFPQTWPSNLGHFVEIPRRSWPPERVWCLRCGTSSWVDRPKIGEVNKFGNSLRLLNNHTTKKIKIIYIYMYTNHKPLYSICIYHKCISHNWTIQNSQDSTFRDPKTPRHREEKSGISWINGVVSWGKSSPDIFLLLQYIYIYIVVSYHQVYSFCYHQK